MTSKKKNELVCCVSCGRDTRAVDAVCVKCRGGKSSKVPASPGRPSATLREQRALAELDYNRENDETGFTNLGQGGDGDEL